MHVCSRLGRLVLPPSADFQSVSRVFSVLSGVRHVSAPTPSPLCLLQASTSRPHSTRSRVLHMMSIELLRINDAHKWYSLACQACCLRHTFAFAQTFMHFGRNCGKMQADEP